MRLKRILFLLMSALLLIGQLSNFTVSAKMTSRLIPDEAVEFGGHYYMIYNDVNQFDGASWEKADKFCKRRGGYLAVITSEDENVFLADYIAQKGYKEVYFGLSLSGGEWKWSDGEVSNYFEWGKNKPTDDADRPYAKFSDSVKKGKWTNGGYGVDGRAYLCEWDSGARLSEADVSDAEKFIREKKSTRFGDSYYRVFNYPLDHAEAVSLCRNMGGHLANIGSREEHDFITKLIKEDGRRNMYWIGAVMDSGKWHWTDGTSLDDYSNWSMEKHNNFAGDAVFAVINAGSDKYDKYSWVAEPVSGEIKADTEAENCINYGFVCEWELICTYDGGSSIAHTDGKWVTEKESTCTETGLRSVYCKKCGQLIRTEDTKEKPHHFDEAGLVGNLTISGIKRIECVKCGKCDTIIEWGKIWIIPAALIFYVTFIRAYGAARDDFEEEAKQKGLEVFTKRISLKALIIAPLAAVMAICIFFAVF